MTVIDASAVLGLVLTEPSSARVVPYLPDGVLSTVNLAEVLGKLTDIGMPVAMGRSVIDRLHIEVVAFTDAEASIAAEMRPQTSHLGLSLGDRACLATALVRDAPVVTFDRAWAKVEVGVSIEVLR